MRLKTSMFCAIFVLINLSATAQHYLLVQAENEKAGEVLAGYSYKKSFFDSVAAQQQISKLVLALQDDGYLLAGVKELSSGADTTRVMLETGSRFRWAKLSAATVNKEWLNRTIWRQNAYTDKPFRYGRVSRLMRELVREAENNGYPFASVKLDSVQVDSTLLMANVQMEQGPYIIFDTLVVKGDVRLNPRFLGAFLGIRYGEPYSQQKVKDAVMLLQGLPYLKLQQEPELTFQNRQATLYLDLGNKKANIIDGVVGVLPDPQEEGRLLFTGQFDLLLQNPFGTGKKIELHWQRLDKNSQNLEAAYYHPHLFGSVISLDAGFSLLKEEENFVNRQLSLEMQMRQGAGNLIRLIARQKDSRLLGAAQDAGYAGFNLAQFGLGFTRQKLDDPVSPQRGYSFTMDFTGGKKNFRSVLYSQDSIQQALSGSAMQYRLTGQARYFLPIGQHLVWAHSLEAGFLEDENIYINDLYRLGGLSSLRGFREKSFFASDFVVSRLELRYLASRDTYLFGFYDQGRMEQMAGNLHVTDWPLGCGAGLSLGTNSGTFNFVYGAGKSGTQPLSFAQSQVHFGYVNRF